MMRNELYRLHILHLAALLSSDNAMNDMRKLYAFIYGCSQKAVYCGHCGRPLYVEEEKGKKVLICHRCIELQKEWQQEMIDNLHYYEERERRKKNHG